MKVCLSISYLMFRLDFIMPMNSASFIAFPIPDDAPVIKIVLLIIFKVLQLIMKQS